VDLKHSDYHRGFLINVFKEGRVYRLKVTSKLSGELDFSEKNYTFITGAIDDAKERIDARFKKVDNTTSFKP